MNYCFNKLGLGIYKLAIGEGDIKSRLIEAFPHICAISEGEFPSELENEWRSIITRLTKNSSKFIGTEFDEGKLKATMKRMHRKTAVKIAKDIIELHSKLEDYLEDK